MLMKNHESQMTFILCAFISVLINGSVAHELNRDLPKVQICGRRIAESLNFFCGNRQNLLNKRTFSNIEDEYEAINEDTWQDLREPDYLLSSLYNDDPFISKSKALPLVSDDNFRKRQTGIVDECCRKPCRLDELESYCDNRR